MKKIVVLTGAGISAESGIKTFRDTNGLWEEYRVEDVATYDAWLRNPKLVLEFYNQRRRQLDSVKPNAAHFALAELETKFDVQIITQNVDNLHERGGSTKILHLHGELIKARSCVDEDLVYDFTGKDINWGDTCAKGSQLRPHIVWFGEAVPNMMFANSMVNNADILIVIGTSLNVYPAANLLFSAPSKIEKYYIDPNAASTSGVRNIEIIKESAAKGVPELVKKMLANI